MTIASCLLFWENRDPWGENREASGRVRRERGTAASGSGKFSRAS